MTTKFDNAAYYAADGATENQAVAHIALFFRWCAERGLLSDEHTQDDDFAAALARAQRGELTFGDYLWDYLSGKLTSDDLSPEGAAFAEAYYRDFVGDLSRRTGKQPLSFNEREVDFDQVRTLLDSRFAEHCSRSVVPPRPWWRFW